MIQLHINWYGLLFAAIISFVFVLIDLRCGWASRGRI